MSGERVLKGAWRNSWLRRPRIKHRHRPTAWPHRHSGLFPVGIKDVTVDVGGHPNRGMTENLTHDLDLDSLGLERPLSPRFPFDWNVSSQVINFVERESTIRAEIYHPRASRSKSCERRNGGGKIHQLEWRTAGCRMIRFAELPVSYRSPTDDPRQSSI